MTPDERKAIETEYQQVWHEVKSLKEDVGSLQEASKGGLTADQIKSMTTRMDELEVKLRAPRAPSGSDVAPLDRKARARYASYLDKPAAEITHDDVDQVKADFESYLKKGDGHGLELKTLRTDSNVDGGYLVVPEFADFIIKDLSEISAMRGIARVRQTASNVFKAPTRTALPSAQWLGEEEQDALTDADYGLEEVPNGTMRATTRATREQLEDSAFDMEAELRADMGESYAIAEGTSFVSGNGVRKPKGFLEDSRITSVVTGNASAVTYAGLVNLSHGINSNYFNSSRFVFNLGTLGDLRLLEDGDSSLIFTPGVNDIASTILGRPFTLLPDMPDVGAGNVPIAFGDFARGYLIVDRVSMSILRDPYSAKRYGAVEFTGYKRVGGQVILATAIRTQTVST